MNRASTTTTDTASILHTSIKRLSFFSNIDVILSGVDDDDDDDDEDSESDEEEEVEKKRASTTTTTSNTHRQMTMTGRFLEALHENSREELVAETSKSGVIDTPGQPIVEEQSSGTAMDEARHPIDITSPPPLQPLHSSTSSVLSLEPLEIKTDFAGQFDNRKSPREQMFKMSMELEAKNNEIEMLKIAHERLKMEHGDLRNRYESETQELRDKNKNLIEELDCFKKLVRHIDESGKDTTELKQVQSENQTLKHEITRLSSQISTLVKQNEHLKKYESLVNQMKFTSINSNLYTIINEIGAGGFSRVYQAVRIKDSKNCAIKRVDLSKLDPESVEHVKNEIRLLKGLHGTQKCIQLIEDEHVAQKNQLNIVMELGSSDLNSFFKKLVKENNEVPEPTRAYYWYKMLQAVDAIHKKDVIHSDLKPGNFIMVGCEVKLIDFNTSTAMTSERTSITMSTDCGTMQYMAPEMLMKNEESKSMINTKTDIWSMGVILYYMAYGRLPFQKYNQYQLFYAICDKNQTSIKYEPRLKDHHLEQCIKQCLSYESRDRPSAEELLKHPYLIKNYEQPVVHK